MPEYGIIGGTGVYDPGLLTDVQTKKVETPFGDVEVDIGTYNDRRVAFIPRHGKKHSLPPHRINYRGNIAALKLLGVNHVLATAAVGSLNSGYEPGVFVLCHQFIDFTKNRITSFYDGPGKVVHIDFTEPYCPDGIKAASKAAKKLGYPLQGGATYVATEGPRFETPAEIQMYRLLGGDLVGMTGVPEVILAREACMCYNSIALVANFAAGISPTPLSHQEVLDMMAANLPQLKSLLLETVLMLPVQKSCRCCQGIEPPSFLNRRGKP